MAFSLLVFTMFYLLVADPTEVNQQNVSAVHLLNAESFNKTW